MEIKPICENCGKKLPYNSLEARICSFECTFCNECVNTVLFNVCPNCGGGFEKRPVRPTAQLNRYPVTQKEFFNPIDKAKFESTLRKYKDVDPGLR